MAGVLAIDSNGVSREFSCEQFALMGSALPTGWTYISSTCGIYFDYFRSPFASYGIEFSGTTLPGKWYPYQDTITTNRVIIPTATLVLPTIHDNVEVYVRRQRYQPSDPVTTRDFTVNNTDNSIDFESGLGLSGQLAYIRVFR